VVEQPCGFQHLIFAQKEQSLNRMEDNAFRDQGLFIELFRKFGEYPACLLHSRKVKTDTVLCEFAFVCSDKAG
jgi:hypothetical protein